MNLRDRRASQAVRHVKQVADLQQELEQARSLLSGFMNTGPYNMGFHHGVTVGVSQLMKWLTASRDSAQEKIQRLADYNNEHFMRGHDFAAEWIDWAIHELHQNLEERAHAVATGQQEEGQPGDRSGVRPGDEGRVPSGTRLGGGGQLQSGEVPGHTASRPG